MRFFTRWINHASRTTILAIPFLAIILLPAAFALARAGGGEGFSGGGGFGGGGGGGGGGADLVFLLIQLFIYHPLIGIVVVVIVIAFSAHGGKTSYQSSILQRGTAAIGQQNKRSAISLIQQHDPQFSEQQLCNRVATAFAKIQQAWSNQDLQSVRPFISDGVSERFSIQFAEQRAEGWRNIVDHLHIADVHIADVTSSGVFDEVAISISASASDYHVALNDGRRLQGSTFPEPFTEIWSFLRRRSAVTAVNKTGLIEGNCPNCGAPISINESANCKNCHAVLRSGEYDWVLTEITQESEWERSDFRSIPGLDLLRQKDQGFDPLGLEDHASVIFWRKAATDISGKIDSLRKVAGEDFCQRYAPMLAAQPGQKRSYIGQSAVGSVKMTGFVPATSEQDMDRTLVEIHWSGHILPANTPILRHSLFVLARKANVKTDASKSISSAHCPNCGAPDSGGVANVCPFCGTVLNDGSQYWILSDILLCTDPKAQELLNATVRPGSPQAGSTNLTAGGSRMPQGPGSDWRMLAWAVKMTAGNGQIDPAKLSILQAFASNHGIFPQSLDHMLASATRGELQVPEPADAAEARDWITSLMQMAISQGQIDPNEFQLMLHLGERFGISSEDIKLLAERVRADQYRAAANALRTG